MGLLLLTGLLPLAVGWLINWHMMLHPDTFPPLFLIGLAGLFVWAWIARNMNKKMVNTGMVMLGQNAAGLLAIFMHRANIKRLLSGTEKKATFSKFKKQK